MSSRNVDFPDLETVQGHWAQRTSAAISLGAPDRSTLRIAPDRNTLSIRVLADAGAPGLRRERALTTTTVVEGGVRFFQLDLATESDALVEALAFLRSVVDRIAAGSNFDQSVDDALRAYGSILSRRFRLSEEQEIGLIGELLLLVALVGSGVAPDDAVTAWFGPAGGEHDFRLPEVDVEVKTTRSDRRAHWISSLTQLRPANGRPLSLLSLQLTAATPAIGFTLPMVVERATSLAGESARTLESLISERYGAADAQLYSSYWSLRSEPAWFAVDGSFPAITDASVAAMVPDPAAVLAVSYRIDLSTRAPGHTLVPAHCFSLTDRPEAS